MAEKEENKNSKIKVLTPEQAEKLGPQAVVMSNARLLVHSDLKVTKDLLDKSLEYIKEQLTKEEDFRDNVNSLVGVQIQLASLSLAFEYWIAKQQKKRIKVYNQNDMPKA